MKKYPFKFLDSYNREDRGIFFGRDEEIAALYEMVFQSSIILVYGASGTGKTSLINCGLAGKFQPHDWLALMVRRGNNLNKSLEKVLNDAGGKTTTLTEEFNWSDEWSDDVEKTAPQLTPIGKSIKAIYQKSFRPVYLIFDQFEELFILGSASEQELFIQSVKDILQSEQPVKMIFAIREEYLGHLFEFERAVPQLLQKKLRIEPMNLEKVKQVIIGAAEHEDSNISIKQGESDQVAEGIFDKIKGNEKSRTIQLPFLQVFLDKFYLKITGDKKRKAEAEFNLQALNEMGEIGDILVNFLEEQVSSISQRLKDKNPSLNVDRTWAILSPFSTLEGTKEPINKEDLYKRLPDFDTGIIDDVVDAFINSRILRYNEGADMFEIAHDALAKPIAEKRSLEETALLEIKRLIESQVAVKEEAREYFTEKQLVYIEPYVEKFNVGEEEQKWITKSEEYNKQTHNKELVKTRKRLRTVYSILGVAAIALIAAVFFIVLSYYAVNRANKAEEAANNAKIEANNQKQKSQILTLVAIATEQLDKNPTMSIRLAEMAWHKTNPPTLSAQKIVSKVFYESLDHKDLFFMKDLKHMDAVLCAVYSTDGKKIVTASGDNTAKIWDAESGKLLFVLKGHDAIVYSAVFSPDGKRIVTASKDCTAKIWDVESGQLLVDLNRHGDEVRSAVFSTDGKRIVTASKDKTAKIWDAESGKRLFDLKGHWAEVSSAVFSPDGKRVVTASGDYSAKIWDVESGKIINLKEHRGPLYSAVFSPACPADPIGGKRILTASYDHTAKIWDIESGKKITLQHESPVFSAVFSPDGKRIVTASKDNTAKIWDAESGKKLFDLKGHGGEVSSAVFSPDGKLIVTASEDNTAKIWDVESGQQVADLKGHGAAVYSAVFSPNGKTIVTASYDHTSKIWEIESEIKFANLKGNGVALSSAIFSPDGKTIVTASKDGTAKTWDVESGKELCDLIGHEDEVSSAVFSPDGKLIVTASYDTLAKIWDVESGKKLFDLIGHRAPVYSAVFSPDGKRIVTASGDKTAMIWDVESGQKLFILKEHGGEVRSAVFSPDGKLIVTASFDSIAKIWDVESGKKLFDLEGHKGYIYSAVFSPDGKRIVTASYDHTAKIWDVESGKKLFDLKEHSDAVSSAVFSPDGKTIVTASYDHTAKIWDVESGTKLFDLKGHGDEVRSAVFSKDGKRIVTASFDKTAKIWDVESGKLLADLKGHEDKVRSAVFSPDGKKIVTASFDGNAKIWLTPEGIIDWLDQQKNIYKLTDEDLKNLGIDFVYLKK